MERCWQSQGLGRTCETINREEREVRKEEHKKNLCGLSVLGGSFEKGSLIEFWLLFDQCPRDVLMQYTRNQSLVWNPFTDGAFLQCE